MSGRAPTPRSHCQNCSALLHGPYCSACGQHDFDYSGSFWHIIEDGLEGALHFDGKFFKSARYIFTRPGFLTTEFIAGRRARYMHPVRFYVFASFLFFAATLLMSRDRAHRASEAPALTAVSIPGSKSGDPAKQLIVVRGLAPNESWLDDPLQITVDPKDKVNERDLVNEIWHLLPAMLILCLPILALVLKLAYLRTGRLHLEHLIFALHVQALAFLSFIVIKGTGLLASLVSKRFESIVGLILMMGMYYLIYRAFRTVYHQGRAVTALKLMFVLVVYGLILLAAFVALGNASGYLVSRSA
jgi:hypothetical protein